MRDQQLVTGLALMISGYFSNVMRTLNVSLEYGYRTSLA